MPSGLYISNASLPFYLYRTLRLRLKTAVAYNVHMYWHWRYSSRSIKGLRIRTRLELKRNPVRCLANVQCCHIVIVVSINHVLIIHLLYEGAPQSTAPMKAPPPKNTASDIFQFFYNQNVALTIHVGLEHILFMKRKPFFVFPIW